MSKKPLNLKSANLRNLSLRQLEKLRDSLDLFMFGSRPTGEQWHPEYKKNKPIFKKLTYQTVRFRNDILRYFEDQAKRLRTLVYINKITADDNSDWLNIQQWQQEDGTLATIVEVYLSTMFTLGATGFGEELGAPTGLDQASPAAKFLANYALKLAGDINTTTKKRILQQINAGITLGESSFQIADRLTNIIESPSRALTIAQTESVRAYSKGRDAVATDMGATGKYWLTTIDPCPICESIPTDVIDINEAFVSDANGDDAFEPPMHTNCKCLVRYVFANQDNSGNSDNVDNSDNTDENSG